MGLAAYDVKTCSARSPRPSRAEAGGGAVRATNHKDRLRSMMDPVRDLSNCSWRLFRVMTSFVVTLVLVTLASCSGTQSEEGVAPPSASPSAGNVSSSPNSPAESLRQLTDCKGLRVPRVELDTNLDRKAGLLTVNYTTRRDAQNRSFTIAYDDPSCGRNPEVQKLLRNVGVCRLFEPFLQCALRRLHALRVRLEHQLDREA